MERASSVQLQCQSEAPGSCFYRSLLKTTFNRVDIWCMSISFIHVWNTEKCASSLLYLECLLFQKLMRPVCGTNMARGALVTVGGELASYGPWLRCCRAAALVRILSAVRLPFYAVQFLYVTDNVKFPTTHRVICVKLHVFAHLTPFWHLPLLHFFPLFLLPRTSMLLQNHSQLFWGFLMDKAYKAKWFPFASFVKFVPADQVI